ncbi:Lipid phosphate phosphatase [Musa troglodytarum]|uniref:Lipid phosphate phosphatase n=1 Tax=Musa troglodytarum TaxID=320322 RepID=A0A9E7H5J0_9LILI|nr:Lipid phosphate phosphatase [Musa troglodytarum]
MRANSLPSFTLLLSILVLFLISFSRRIEPAAAGGEETGGCEVSSCCGDAANIRDPFWFSGGNAFFGDPAYEVECRGGLRILTNSLGGGSYFIKHIFYDNKSFVVANTQFARGDCPVPRDDSQFGLHDHFDHHFTISTANKVLFLFRNCSEIPPGHHEGIQCASDTFADLAESYDYSKPPNWSSKCEVVSAPVLPYGAEEESGRTNYEELLKNGFLVEWWSNPEGCEECKESGGKCGSDHQTGDFVCHCPGGWDDPGSCGKFHNFHKKWIAIGPVVGLVSFLLVCAALFFYENGFDLSNIFLNKTDNTQNIEAFLNNYGSVAPKRYKYSDLKNMTNSFREKLGAGGYGSVKGTLQDGRVVAVKILSKSKENGAEFMNEVASIGRTSHVNIVGLLGFCLDGHRRALIYEFMANGSLEKYIFRISQRKLFLGANYEDFSPKISDFGLAKLCSQKETILSVADARGTAGYIAPEVFCRSVGVASTKSDVYSYGMMILEMAGGRKNVKAHADRTSEVYFPHWVYEHVDRGGELRAYDVTAETEEIARKMVLVGLWCIQMVPADRPSMSRVVEMLEGRISDIEMPPKPYLSSPPGSDATPPRAPRLHVGRDLSRTEKRPDPALRSPPLLPPSYPNPPGSIQAGRSLPHLARCDDGTGGDGHLRRRRCPRLCGLRRLLPSLSRRRLVGRTVLFVCRRGGVVAPPADVQLRGPHRPPPHRQALCYLGGETRIVVVDRHSSLADLSAKLSRTLLGGRPFSLKYQLPNEDLDSLISVATDEDLDNMIEEFDRISAAAGGVAGGSTRSPRLRLFLFPSKPESGHSSTIGSLLDESKSGTWVVDALNSAIGCMGMDGLPRDFSADSASINGILGLEDNSSVHSRSGAHRDPEQLGLHRPDSSCKLGRHGLEAHSVPDSQMLDKSSSFGSTSSAPSLSNLPPIPVPTDDRPADHRIAGLDDHLAHMRFSPDSATSQRPNEGFKEPIYAPQRPPPPNPLPTDSVSSPTISATENFNRVFSDDERSEHAGLRKLPQPPKPTQIGATALDPASRPTYLNPNSDPKTEQLQQQHFHPHLYQQQPQFIPRNPHYIHHPAMPSYYPTSAHPTQQSHPFDPQLPLYYMHVGHPVPYPLAAVQPNLADPNSASLSGMLAVPVSGVPTKHDLPPSMYRAAAQGPAPAALQPQLISVSSNQAHAYAGTGYQLMQQPHLSQSPAAMANYGYEVAAAPGHPQMYYSQASSQPGRTLQYQTMSSTTVIPDAAASEDSNAS